MTNAWNIFAFVLIGFVVIAFGFMFFRYFKDIRAAKKRIDLMGSKMIRTSFGPIEYARLGDGYPILVIHGAFGGFDQGLWLANSFDLLKHQIISVSRFGYLRSPIPPKANLNLQADTFAGLLDLLKLDKVAVLGVSAGSTTAIRFVARYPERVSSLILVGPDSPGENYMAMPPRYVMDKILRSNFIYWVWVTFFWKSMKNILSLVPKEYKLTRENEEQIKKVQLGDLPVSERMDGLVYESYDLLPEFFESVTPTSPYPLENIITPVLIVHALDDGIALPGNVRTLAKKLPSARLFSVSEGGHFFFGHGEEVNAEISSFLRSHEIK
jgi:pimeloyl-ACP methyl ester carboxylesterase